MPLLARSHSQLPIRAIRCERVSCFARLRLAAFSSSAALYAALSLFSRRATRRYILSNPWCRPSRPVELVSAKGVAGSRLAPNRPSATRNPATERVMRRPTTASAALDNPSAARPYANALIQPPVSKGNSSACVSTTAAIACPVKLNTNAARTFLNRLPGGSCNRGFAFVSCS